MTPPTEPVPYSDREIEAMRAVTLRRAMTVEEYAALKTTASSVRVRQRRWLATLDKVRADESRAWIGYLKEYAALLGIDTTREGDEPGQIQIHDAIVELKARAEKAESDLAAARRVVEVARKWAAAENVRDETADALLEAVHDASLPAPSGAKWEPKGAAHDVEARGERPRRIRVTKTGPMSSSRVTAGVVYDVKEWTSGGQPIVEGEGGTCTLCAEQHKYGYSEWEPAASPRVEAKPAPSAPSQERCPGCNSSKRSYRATLSLEDTPPECRDPWHDAKGEDEPRA